MKTLIISTAAGAALFGCATTIEVPDKLVAEVYQRDFKTRGQAKADWVVQDEVQRVCTESGDKPPEAVAKKLEETQFRTIKYPAGSLMGDWKKGHAIAQDGRGMTWNAKPSTNNGGSCYNCHELSPQEQSFGTLGPSLRNYGKIRGNSEAIVRYTYGKLYNAKAFNACSGMPRFGHTASLTEQQMKDLTAYLLHPDSPVNK